MKKFIRCSVGYKLRIREVYLFLLKIRAKISLKFTFPITAQYHNFECYTTRGET